MFSIGWKKKCAIAMEERDRARKERDEARKNRDEWIATVDRARKERDEALAKIAALETERSETEDILSTLTAIFARR